MQKSLVPSMSHLLTTTIRPEASMAMSTPAELLPSMSSAISPFSAPKPRSILSSQLAAGLIASSEPTSATKTAGMNSFFNTFCCLSRMRLVSKLRANAKKIYSHLTTRLQDPQCAHPILSWHVCNANSCKYLARMATTTMVLSRHHRWHSLFVSPMLMAESPLPLIVQRDKNLSCR